MVTDDVSLCKNGRKTRACTHTFRKRRHFVPDVTLEREPTVDVPEVELLRELNDVGSISMNNIMIE